MFRFTEKNCVNELVLELIFKEFTKCSSCDSSLETAGQNRVLKEILFGKQLHVISIQKNVNFLSSYDTNRKYGDTPNKDTTLI